ncbi:MAG: dihydrolipoyl dehydrogenase [Desulfonauticus sp.]|nr:dihydrolipoyl dehydrogenase [Desulfonauticus sp.]
MYDLIIIGGGPGGYAAAISAGQAGLKTALIEKKYLGGTCLNVGCIPTKLLLGYTEPIENIKHLKRLRLGDGQFSPDIKSIIKRKNNIINATQKSIAQSLKKLGVEVYTDKAFFINPQTIKLATSNKELLFKHAIIATGSKSTALPGTSFNGQTILSSTDILNLETIPSSLAIIGAGAIGLELGQFFSRLGTRIILIEALNHPAPLEDQDIGQEIQKHLKKEGWELYFQTRVEQITTTNNQVHIDLGFKTIQVEKCLLAIGRSPNTQELNLENCEINLDTRFIPVNEYLQVTKNIFAIGDVNGKIMLAHAAEDQGRYVVKFITQKITTPYFPRIIPSCIYGFPEVMSVGKKEKELKDYQVTKALLAANPIAQAHGVSSGFVKVIWQNNKVVGISAVGYKVSHLVTLATIIVSQGWTKETTHNYIFAHPTLDESLKEALLA